jgi:3-hydroxyisobutyrate dehydrogenase
MTAIGFIGLGNMGGPMAANLLKAGHEVVGFDLSKPALDAFGGKKAASVAEAVKNADIVVTMLPAGPHVRSVYAEHVLPNARAGGGRALRTRGERRDGKARFLGDGAVRQGEPIAGIT